MAIGKGLASQQNKRLRIEWPVAGEGFDDAGSGTWELVAEVSAEVQDMLPSRGERLADGINVASRPARVRIRYRTDLAASMRVLVGRRLRDGDGNSYWQTDRVAEIVTVPAELGWRERLEFMIEDYSSAGNSA